MGRTPGIALALAVVGAIGATAVPAYAQTLDEWLDRAADAEYEGRQVTICNTPDGTLSDVVDVAQKDGMVAVGAPDGPVVFRSDAVEAEGARAGDGAGEPARADLADRYSVSVRAASTFLDRSVDVVDVLDGDSVRVSYVFDDETGAILQSEVRHADGSMYCTTQFIEFRARTDLRSDGSITDTVEPSEDHQLPERLGDFVRLDIYAGPNSSTAAFYSDGVFSFTVITADARIDVAELRDAPQVTVGGREYVRRYTVGQVVYAWETRQGGYVLIGDPPPDLHGDVLDDLPAPGKANFIMRVWRRIFR